jgi:cellulose biosynthesis protein BcsQ
MTAEIITVTNLKGGVGKTTTTYALTCAAVAQGLRTLSIDLDPTGGLSSTLERKGTYPATLFDVLRGRKIPLQEALVTHHLGAMPNGRQLLYTVPADQRMDEEGTSAEELREILGPVMAEFDIIMIDTQPHRPGIIGPIEVADIVVIPTLLEMLSMRTSAMTAGLIMKMGMLHKLKGLVVTGERRPLVGISAQLLQGLQLNGLCFSDAAILWWNGGLETSDQRERGSGPRKSC